MNNTTDIDFFCPYCTQKLNGPADLAGQTVTCPVCNKSFEIPAGIITTNTTISQPFPSFVTPLNGEELLSVTRPSWLYFLGKYILGFLSLLIGIVCGVIGNRTQSPIVLIVILAYFGFFYLLWTTVKMLIFNHSYLYVMTNLRVMAKKGLFSVSTSEVRIADIRGANLRQGIVERMFDVGSIAIGSAATAGTEVVFKGIRKPRHFLALINSQRKS